VPASLIPAAGLDEFVNGLASVKRTVDRMDEDDR
jgi:hypothetical protein